MPRVCVRRFSRHGSSAYWLTRGVGASCRLRRACATLRPLTAFRVTWPDCSCGRSRPPGSRTRERSCPSGARAREATGQPCSCNRLWRRDPRRAGAVLLALLRRLPDGTPEQLERPLTPLLDTTVLTNAPGEPAVGHELRAEVPSADGIDVVMAFIRWSGIRPLLDVLRRHCQAGKPLRVLTTTYTNSTEQRALDELASLGAQVRVSYDTTMTRLHAKAWIFHRHDGYSTAYIGSSNLTHSAQVTGLEWNVRAVRRPQPRRARQDGGGLRELLGEPRLRPATTRASSASERAIAASGADVRCSARSRSSCGRSRSDCSSRSRSRAHQGHHRNLLVAATGTGKTVMAAVDYARLRPRAAPDRLLFVAHREEILDQSRATFRHALRDAVVRREVGRRRSGRRGSSTSSRRSRA